MEEIVNEINRIVDITTEEMFISRADFSDLMVLISKTPKYSVFDNYIHWIGTTGINLTHQKFAQALIRRAREVGGKKTLEEIDEYLNSNIIEIKCGLVLDQGYTSSNFTFSNGVQLVNINNIDDSQAKDWLLRDSLFGLAEGAVLVTDYHMPERNYQDTSSPPSDWTNSKTLEEKRLILDDTRYLISLSRHASYGISISYLIQIIPKNLSFLSGGISVSNFNETKSMLSPELIGIELRKADDLIEKYSSLDEPTKDRMRIVLKRLNDSKTESNWANKGINLRICLENLFLNKGEIYQISQKLRERVPTITSFTKTQTKDVYAYLSTAVHTGETDPNSDVSVEEITTELQKVAKNYLEDGTYPMW